MENLRDDEEAQYPEVDSPEGERDTWQERLADDVAAIANTLASIAQSLNGLLVLYEARGKRAPKLLPDVPPPPALASLKLYAADKRLCQRWPELFEEWKRAYPGVNVIAEVCRAHAWEISNPGKVKRDRPKFLANWLAREQDRGRGPVRSLPQAAKSPAERKEDDAAMQKYLEGKWGGQG